jgi:hypothetical protein
MIHYKVLKHLKQCYTQKMKRYKQEDFYGIIAAMALLAYFGILAYAIIY